MPAPAGFSYTQTDTVSGNGTYTAGDTLATMVMVARPSPRSTLFPYTTLFRSAQDQGGTAEQTIVSAANPTVTTTASSSFTLGTTAPTLTDSEIGRAHD